MRVQICRLIDMLEKPYEIKFQIGMNENRDLNVFTACMLK